jgi:hypothetical protein
LACWVPYDLALSVQREAERAAVSDRGAQRLLEGAPTYVHALQTL